MGKNNVKCFRLSDELIELIDQQIGDTFTAKFEALVTRCVWELPHKEAELKRIEDLIQKKRAQLTQMNQQAHVLEHNLFTISNQMTNLKKTIEQATQKWEA